MKKKELRDHCWRVYEYFNNIICGDSEMHDEIFSLCSEITSGNLPKIIKFENENEKELEEKGGGYPLENLCAVAFAIGFCFSEMFEVPYPKFGKEIESIGKSLKEMKTLPYLPRGKAA